MLYGIIESPKDVFVLSLIPFRCNVVLSKCCLHYNQSGTIGVLSKSFYRMYRLMDLSVIKCKLDENHAVL